MNLLDELRQYILNTYPDLQIWVDFLPASPDEGVSIVEYGGSASTGYARRDVQINVRGLGNRVAHDISWDIFNLFVYNEEVEGIPFQSTYWGVCNVKQTPFKREVDGQGRTIFTFNMSVVTTFDRR